MKENSKEASLLLVGAGAMAVEYARVLKALKINFITVGRGKASAKNFSKTTERPVITGGLKVWLRKKEKLPEHSIVAVGEKELGKAALDLLQAGAEKILIEKPGGFDRKEIGRVARIAKNKKVKVFVGYNRRFYASVNKAREIIRKDGGVLSFNFEFTEWSQVIRRLKKAKGVKENWFWHNSTHVIDLAFFLGGKMKEISSYKEESLTWHPKGAVFCGAGVSENKALFSYQANWKAPGRWGIEILTRKHRLILRPLEQLKVQNLGSIEIKEVPLNDKKDKLFKPGLYNEVEAFLKEKPGLLCSIGEQSSNLKAYAKILKQ